MRNFNKQLTQQIANILVSFPLHLNLLRSQILLLSGFTLSFNEYIVVFINKCIHLVIIVYSGSRFVYNSNWFIVRAIHLYLIDNLVPLHQWQKSIWFHFLAVHYKTNIAQYGQSSGYYVCRLLIYTHIWLRIKTQNSAKAHGILCISRRRQEKLNKRQTQQNPKRKKQKCSYRSSQPAQSTYQLNRL